MFYDILHTSPTLTLELIMKTSNTSLRIFASLTLVTAAGISAYLTYGFCYEIGSLINASVIMAMIGLLLDLVKTMMPKIVMVLRKDNFYAAVAAGVFGVVLSAISIAATIYTLNSGLSAAGEVTAKSDREYLAITAQIDNLQSRKQLLESLAAKQLDANLLTRNKETLISLDHVSADMNTLISKRAALKPSKGNIISDYGYVISIVIAVSLELISLLMSAVLASCGDKAVVVDVERVVLPTTKPVAVKVSKVIPAKTKDLDVIFAAKEEVDFTEIKEAIISGSVKPSHRALRNMFALSQEKITAIQRSLYKEGVLVGWNNGGYRLAK